jgi:hypothetical protein
MCCKVSQGRRRHKPLMSPYVFGAIAIAYMNAWTWSRLPWEADSYSNSQEIPHCIQNRKSIIVFAKARHWLLFSARWIIQSYSFKVHFNNNISCTYRTPKWLFPFSFLTLYILKLMWITHKNSVRASQDTLCLRNKDQQVEAVSGNKRCLLWESYETHEHTMRRVC